MALKKFGVLYLIILLLAKSSMLSFSQIIGIKGGMNISNMVESRQNIHLSDNHSNLLGYNLGVSYVKKLSQNIMIESNLNISLKGYRTNNRIYFISDSVDHKLSTSLTYLDLPIYAVFTKQFDKLNGFIKFGPYIGLGLFGRNKHTLVSGSSVKNTIVDYVSWGSNKYKDNFVRFDYGFSLGVGLELKPLQVCISNYHGLANTAINTFENNSNYHRAYSITITYFLKDK